MKKTEHTVVVLFAISIVICGLVGVASGQDLEPAGTLMKSFPASDPLVIPAAAFASKGNDPSSHQMVWWQGYVAGTDSLGGCVQAPVYLPRFAIITSVIMSYIDEDAGQDFSVYLSRTSLNSPGEMDDLANLSSAGSSADVRTTFDNTIIHPIVMHPDYAYFVSTCLPSTSTKLISVRVYYDSDAVFVDGFERGTTAAWGGSQR